MANVTVVYYKSSGEVLKISKSKRGKPALDLRGSFDPDFFGQLDDPTFVAPASPDSILPKHDLSRKLVGAEGSLIADPATNTVRMATQLEWESFDSARTQIENGFEAKEAERRLLTSPRYRRAFKALVRRIVDVTNKQASQINGIKAAIVNAQNMSQVQSAIRDLPSLNDSITLEQALQALKNDIRADD